MTNWTTACPGWEKRIVAGQSLIPCLPLFPDEAEAALNVFKGLYVVDVAGSPTFGEAGEDWIFDFVAAIFGAHDNESGRRLIREFFLCIAKKNGKSTLAAGVMLTALIRNWRHSAELLILAPTIEAAQNSFKPAADMVRADPELDASAQGFLHIQDHLRTITHLKTKATLKVVAADGKTVVGKKAGFILLDELWEFGTKNNADGMLREATGGLVSRPEGFIISITTQADAPPAGVFADKLNYARDVRDGIIEDKKFLPIIYEFPKPMLEDGSYLDPKNFYVTNPNLGRSVSQEWLEDELRKEMEKGSETRNTFLAKHLNVEIGLNLRSNRWAGADFWEAKADKTITLDLILDQCEVIVPGIDGGGLDDLFGLSVVGRHKVTKDWLCWSHAWCHKGVLERRKSISTRLLDFQAKSELTIVDDKLDDLSSIIEIIQVVKDSNKLAAVAIDPAGVGELVDALDAIGVTQEAENLIGALQGYQMMNAIKTTERKLANGTFRHSGSSLMSWCVSNLKIEPTATAIRATKQNAGDAKIDPVMALFDAVTVMSRNPEAAISLDVQAMVA
ncbi:phage terminase large subunit-like protein [Phyllobacterium ifriqiyense]|uniref:Phage terminase large subunit-like protein n=1 Tax=Phyllobacterium ifriqiyense TaxID=314238 RepID=A0ABU0S803_9HYPH|nr:terminase large subunit [Phyllobacterium ifriqiyense]MDQ0996889.1 phage terminase large subunit-like protein [Phyllobacterium ifriqiyense]